MKNWDIYIGNVFGIFLFCLGVALISAWFYIDEGDLFVRNSRIILSTILMGVGLFFITHNILRSILYKQGD